MTTNNGTVSQILALADTSAFHEAFTIDNRDYSAEPFVVAQLDTIVNDENIKAQLKARLLAKHADGLGATFAHGLADENKNYQYIFATIDFKDAVAVVGKTSFWKSEQSNLGDVFRPYARSNSNKTARAMLKAYSLKASVNVNAYLKSVVIFPVNVSQYVTQDYKTTSRTIPDVITECIETRVGQLLAKQFRIINAVSHLY